MVRIIIAGPRRSGRTHLMRCILEALLPHVPAVVCDDIRFNPPDVDSNTDDFVITTVMMTDVPPEFLMQSYVFINTRIHPSEHGMTDVMEWPCARCTRGHARQSKLGMCDACYAEEQHRFPMLARARPVVLPLGTNQ